MHLSAPDNSEFFKGHGPISPGYSWQVSPSGGDKAQRWGELDTMNKSAKYEKLGKHWS